MLNFAINHMSLAKRSYLDLLATAHSLECVGVEVRNDLTGSLFDGLSAEEAGAAARAQNVRLFALAEVKAFTDFSARTFADAKRLVEIAAACGAQAVVLIPRCDGHGLGVHERKKNLLTALTELKPLLAEYGVMGFIEPLGFTISSLRSKAEAIEAIEQCGGTAHFKLVHDTFHHYLAKEASVYPEYTGMVHVSGVVDTSITAESMADGHRVLVDDNDRIENIAQLQALTEAGYNGPISMEAFATTVHDCTDPVKAFAGSFNYIATAVEAHVA